MKKILSALLMAAMVLSVAGCGASTETSENTTESAEVTTTTSVADEDVAETTTAAAEEDATEATTTTTPETEETTTTTEAPKETPKITSEPKIYNDCMVFEADGKNYVYNIADKKMYEYNGESDVYGANGKIIINGSCLSNLETQETYDGNIFRTDYVYEYNPIYKVEESFDGNIYYFGIMSKNGEWSLPMSSDYAICDLAPENSYDIYGATTSLVMISYNTVFDYKNNKMITEKDLDDKSFFAVNGDRILCGTFYNSNEYKNFVAYNTSTGEFTPIYDNIAQFGNTSSAKTYYITDINNECFVILGENFEKLYEITGYEPRKIFDANENYVVFASKGADGGNYTIILDKGGNRVVEPFKPSSNATVKITGDYVISGSLATPVEKIINCKTGEIIECKCKQFSASTGMMVVESDGAYYLAHVSDPDTLINPFEQ